MADSTTIEAILWDDWHPVAEAATLARTGRAQTRLLGVPVTVSTDAAPDGVRARRNDGASVPAAIKYGFVWICLGRPAQPVITFAECEEPDRLTATAGSVQVAVSGLRAVENFLDLSHLAYVHEGYLGEQPHTEIAPYSVAPLPGGGIIATDCRVYQPRPSPVDSGGFDVDYVYAVWRPYTVVLYKANPVEKHRKDMIALFVQPVTEETCVAHILTSYLPHAVDPAAVRRFQQFIFGQDRPILENQLPKRLPLEPRAEVSVRSDGSSAGYRRWLSASGVRFGAIPAA